MRVGLYGGSFNPVHEGHVHVAETALKRLALDRVWWLVTPQNPLKSPDQTADYAERFAAVAEVAENPRFSISDIEARLGLTTTIETVNAVQTRWPRTRFVWIMGADSLASFHRWRDWRSIAQSLPLAVIARPGSALAPLSAPAAQTLRSQRLQEESAPALLDISPAKWIFLHARLSSASSTDLRNSR